MESVACSCCVYLSSLIVIIVIFVTTLWLGLDAKNPECSIEQFYLPALNTSVNPQKINTTLYFHLKLTNPNDAKGIYYHALNITFYYQPSATTNFTMIGNKTIPKFYQGHKKKATKKESVETKGVDWKASFNQTVVFKVKVATVVKFKIVFWKGKKRSKINVGAEVKVGGLGTKINKKGIKLKSDASKSGRYHKLLLLGVLMISSYILYS